ncbi:anti-sigma factor [Streptomyces sp. JCM17656]|nr:anti-sigma factor [Streptomyces sp. JCM17656]
MLRDHRRRARPRGCLRGGRPHPAGARGVPAARGRLPRLRARDRTSSAGRHLARSRGRPHPTAGSEGPCPRRGGPDPSAPPTLPAREGERRARRFTPRMLNLALAACLAAAAAFGGLAAWQHQEAQQARQAADSQTADFARLLSAPDTTFVRQDVSYGGSGTVAVSRHLDQAAYFCEDLAPLPPDRIYQLWYIAPGNHVRSAGLLPAGTNLRAVSLPRPVRPPHSPSPSSRARAPPNPAANPSPPGLSPPSDGVLRASPCA